jgi:CubicO group peptidase (beta-lactamase class C family)
MNALASVLVIAGMAAATTTPLTSDELAALYRARFEATMKAGGIFTQYAPMEAVPGATTPQPLPQRPANTTTIRGDALAAASAYAAAASSSAFLVWRHGALERADYFGATTADTQLVSKSLSKPLTAIAVGRALALGHLRSLDTPVADYITEWRGTPKATILIRHLLDMRTGLLEQMFSADPDHPINRVYLDPDHGWHLIHNYPLLHPPGTRYGYSNATSELVAIVLERATRQRYADFIGREVLAPIGAAGGEIWVDRAGGLAHSGCCMTLPAESWLRLGILLLNDGMVNGERLLPAGFVDQMARGTPENPHYGLGVWVAGPYVERRGFGAPGSPGPKVLHSEPYLDRDLFLFDGNSNQTIYVSRATGIVALRLGPTPPKTVDWDNSKLPNLLIGGIRRQPGEVLPQPQPRP